VWATAMASAHANHVLTAPPMLVSESSARNPDRALSVMNKLLFIRAEWDEEAAVWVARTLASPTPALGTMAAAQTRAAVTGTTEHGHLQA
jgi:hypothetical protein